MFEKILNKIHIAAYNIQNILIRTNSIWKWVGLCSILIISIIFYTKFGNLIPEQVRDGFSQSFLKAEFNSEIATIAALVGLLFPLFLTSIGHKPTSDNYKILDWLVHFIMYATGVFAITLGNANSALWSYSLLISSILVNITIYIMQYDRALLDSKLYIKLYRDHTLLRKFHISVFSSIISKYAQNDFKEEWKYIKQNYDEYTSRKIDDFNTRIIAMDFIKSIRADFEFSHLVVKPISKNIIGLLNINKNIENQVNDMVYDLCICVAYKALDPNYKYTTKYTLINVLEKHNLTTNIIKQKYTELGKCYREEHSTKIHDLYDRLEKFYGNKEQVLKFLRHLSVIVNKHEVLNCAGVKPLLLDCDLYGYNFELHNHIEQFILDGNTSPDIVDEINTNPDRYWFPMKLDQDFVDKSYNLLDQKRL